MAIAAHYASLLNTVLLLASLSLLPVVLSLSFNYTAVGQQLFESDLIMYGNVSIQHTSVQLTYYDQNSTQKAGRIFYAEPVTFWSASTGQEASFNCSFQFRITTSNPNGNYGDGLTFLLVDSHFGDVPENCTGKWLGLVNPATNGNASNKIVAVEFDTYPNPEISDPNGNHIGVDINSVISVQDQSELGFDMKSSRSVYAWIDYSSSEHLLDAYATNVSSSKPGVPLISYQVNLSQYLPSTVLVGFSASTGDSFEIHTLDSWSFNCSDIYTGSEKHSIGWKGGVPVAVLLIVVGICIYAWRKRTRRLNRERDSADMIEFPSGTSGPRKFTYKELSVATQDFSSAQQLGQGGFGSVYKGSLPENGRVVAVKRISEKSRQGLKEFRAEVTIISRISHKNLVKLKGWCDENGNLLLVYEYLPNGSLDHYLYRQHLDWSARYRVVCDLGSALQYLHEGCEKVIIHRDVKPSNVMLDADLNAKLGDFGFARQLGQGAVAHTTIAAGTVGYMAPDTYGKVKATTEMDVYSFGVVLLEVGCGRRPAEPEIEPGFDGSLVDWVWDLYGKDKLVGAVDAKLAEFNEAELTRMLIVGLACSHPDAKARPTISKALESLRGRTQLPIIPTSKPVPYYGPPSPQGTHNCL